MVSDSKQGISDVISYVLMLWRTGYRRLCKSWKIANVREGRWTILWNSGRRSVIRIGRPRHRKNYSVLGREIRNKYQSYRRSILLHLCCILGYIFCWRNPRHTLVHSYSLGARICGVSADGCWQYISGANESETTSKSLLAIAGFFSVLRYGH